MEVFIENKRIETPLLQVPTMNYGQMQRWEDFVQLDYVIEIKKELFLEKINDFFVEFRASEIEEDDTEEFPELIAFKNVGWADLSELVKNHTIVLKGLLLFNQYEILHRIIQRPKKSNDYYYSANSVVEILFEDEIVKIKGICFQSDYVQHTYNYELPRTYALLKK